MVVDYGMEPTAIARKQALTAVTDAATALRECGRGEEADALDYSRKWIHENAATYHRIAEIRRDANLELLDRINEYLPTALYRTDFETDAPKEGTVAAKAAYQFILSEMKDLVMKDYEETAAMCRRGWANGR